MDWTPITEAIAQGIVALVGVLVTAAVGFLITYLRELAGNAKDERIRKAIAEAVRAAEQKFATGQNAVKTEFVADVLRKGGIQATETQIESAVCAVKSKPTIKEDCN